MPFCSLIILGIQSSFQNAKSIDPFPIFFAHLAQLGHSISKASIRTHLQHFQRNTVNSTRHNWLNIIFRECRCRNPSYGFAIIPICSSTVANGIIVHITIEQLIRQIVFILCNSLSVRQRREPLFREDFKLRLKEAIIILDRGAIALFCVFQRKGIDIAPVQMVPICNIELQSGSSNRNLYQSICSIRKLNRCTVIVP